MANQNVDKCDACGGEHGSKGMLVVDGPEDAQEDVANICKPCWTRAGRKHGAENRMHMLQASVARSRKVHPELRARIVAVSVVRGALPPLLKDVG